MAQKKDDETPLEKLPRGFRKRTLVTTRLAAKLGKGFAKKTLGRERKGPPPELQDTDKAMEAASALVKELGALKGIVMKFGQMASYMPGALPPQAQRVLSQLQAESTAMAYEQIEEVLERELDDEVSALFDDFSSEPFAAASIGQVHKARHQGRDVAVKIQYPGIDTLMKSDMKTLRRLMRLSFMASDIDGKALAKELQTRIVEECDYTLEAQNQKLFKGLLESRQQGAGVPGVVEERSSQRVLTTEFVAGHNFQDFCDNASQDDRNAAAKLIFSTCFQSIFQDCIYNGDPHPGNYLFHDGGDVTFLDFGCVRRFDSEMIDVWKRVALAVLDDDRATFVALYPELGFVKKPKRFDWDHQWDIMRYLYTPFTATEPFRYTHAYVRESYDLMLFKNPNRFKTAMPPQWLLLNRLQWGLNSILAFLDAEVLWSEPYRAAVESITQPVGD